MDEKEQKKNPGGKAVKYLFPALMIALCAALYLFTGSWKPDESEDATAAAEPEAQEDREAGDAAFSSEKAHVQLVSTYDFWKRAEESGFLVAYEETYLDAQSYLCDIAFGDQTAQLMASLREGGICAFTLVMPLPQQKEYSLIKQDMYGLQSYESQFQWAMQATTAFIRAIDVRQQVTYPDLDEFKRVVKETVGDEKARDTDCSGVLLRVFADRQDEDTAELHLSVDLTEKYLANG